MHKKIDTSPAYYVAPIVPQEATARIKAFEAWHEAAELQDKKDKAYALLCEIAEKYPLDSFLVDDDFGNTECFFCGGGYYKNVPHEDDCFSVLIGEFRNDKR